MRLFKQTRPNKKMSLIPKRVTTETVGRLFRRKADVLDEVKNIVQRVEDCVEEAYRNNLTSCEVPISNIFRVEATSQNDALLAVHSTAMMEIEERGFKVIIRPEPELNRSVLIVSGWELIDDAGRDDMKKYIAARMDQEFTASVPRERRRRKKRE